MSGSPIRSAKENGVDVQGAVAAGFDRIEKLENTLRDCLGVPPLPATGSS